MALEDFKTAINVGTLATGTINGGITDLLVLDNNGKEANVLSTENDWSIKVKWELVGDMLDSPFLNIPGEWEVNAFLEGWGKDADEKDLVNNGGVSVMKGMTIVSPGTGTPPNTEWHYEKEIKISNADNPIAGTYKLAVTINYAHSKATGSMAGFIEHSGMIQFFDPPK